jgi:hypothetical protein
VVAEILATGGRSPPTMNAWPMLRTMQTMTRIRPTCTRCDDAPDGKAPFRAQQPEPNIDVVSPLARRPGLYPVPASPQ